MSEHERPPAQADTDPEAPVSAGPGTRRPSTQAPSATTPEQPDGGATRVTTGPRRPWYRSRRLAGVAALAVAVALVIAGATVPINKVVESPGPTWNVLAGTGQDAGTSAASTGSGAGSASAAGDSTGAAGDSSSDVLTVTGTQTYAADGALRMTTVSVRGCPGYPVTFFEAVAAWLSSSSTVVDRDQVCPSSMSADEVEATNQAQMTSSQDAAVVAALMETGLATRMELSIAGLSDQQASSGLAQGDVIEAITTPDGTRTTIDTYSQLKGILAAVDPGTEVTLDVLRDGATTSVALTTLAPTDSSAAGSLLGVYLSARADSDVDATFGLSDVGGPSAGMMFALGIVDEVTAGDLTGGTDIAGTGTIAIDGSVGAIGGIKQKMAGAHEAGSTVFLAPASNCSDVVGHEPDGMSVYAVSTLHEAVQAVQAVADGTTSGLQTCERVVAGS